MKRAFILSIVVGLSSAPAMADNLNFGFNNPNFGGNPDIGAFLFGLAERQATATINRSPTPSDPAAPGTPQIPGIGGGNIGGPTIIIPIGDLGTEAPPVEVN